MVMSWTWVVVVVVVVEVRESFRHLLNFEGGVGRTCWWLGRIEWRRKPSKHLEQPDNFASFMRDGSTYTKILTAGGKKIRVHILSMFNCKQSSHFKCQLMGKEDSPRGWPWTMRMIVFYIPNPYGILRDTPERTKDKKPTPGFIYFLKMY